MALTDKPINIDNISFDENENVSYVMVLDCICSTCGFSDWSYRGGESALINNLGDVKKSDIYGKSCRTILEEFSKVCFGIWVTDGSNMLTFVPFGTAANEGACGVVNHAKVETGLLAPAYEGVLMVNGDKTFTSGNVSEESNVYTINSVYASQDMANAVMNFLSGILYQPWSCSKAEIDSAVFMNANVRFSDGVVRLCNDLTVYPRAYGIYATLGCSSVEDNELAYNGEITRALNNCIKADEDYNGCMVTRYQGIVFTAEKQSKAKTSEAVVKEKFGFTTSEGGITEYDGAMISKVVPKSATWNSDKTEATVSYEGKQFIYKITRDDSGNITGFTKEEVTA